MSLKIKRSVVLQFSILGILWLHVSVSRTGDGPRRVRARSKTRPAFRVPACSQTHRYAASSVVSVFKLEHALPLQCLLASRFTDSHQRRYSRAVLYRGRRSRPWTHPVPSMCGYHKAGLLTRTCNQNIGSSLYVINTFICGIFLRLLPFPLYYLPFSIRRFLLSPGLRRQQSRDIDISAKAMVLLHQATFDAFRAQTKAAISASSAIPVCVL